MLSKPIKAIDGSHIRALRGGPLTGPSPVDRARTGSKHHLIVDLQGVPLGVALTGGNRIDVTQLLPLVDGVVERTFAWLHNFRRLRIRWERDASMHRALLSLGCALICWLRLER